jgi:CRP/FNR family transcriptional regulator, cyclic AMP receptor protein
MISALPDAAISKCTLFRNMSAAERQELLGLLESKSYAPGETILSEGESFQFIWVVLHGRCQVVKSTGPESEKELAILEACGVFGEMSFFNPGPHSATVRALTDVEVVRLSRENFDTLIRAGSLAAYKLAFNTMGVLIERLRTMDEWLVQRREKSNGAEHHEEWMDFHSKLYNGWQF